MLQGSFLAVIALGMTFVIISGGIDLSVGSNYALGGVLAAYGAQYGLVVAILLPLAVCSLIGLVNGLLIARTGMAPFIVTLASLLFARGLLLALTSEGATTYKVEPRLGVPLARPGHDLRHRRPGVPDADPLRARRRFCCAARGSASRCSPSAAPSSPRC